MPGGVGRGGQPTGPAVLRRAELGGPFQGGGGRAVAAAPQRPPGRALQFGRCALIGPGRRPGQVPGPAVCVLPVGQGRVRGPAFGRGRLVVDRRADQRVREHHRGILDTNQPAEPVQVGRVDAESRGGAGDGRPPTGAGTQQEQGAGPGFQLAYPCREHPLQLSGQRQRLGQRLGSGQLGRTQRTRQLHQCQRVAVRGSQQRVADAGSQRRPAPLRQQCGGSIRLQPG